MPRISNLPTLTTPDNSDELAIVDTSASVTKKITRGDLLKAPLPTNSVTTAAIADGAVTASKVDFTTFRTSVVGTNSVTVPAGKWLISATGNVYSATKTLRTISLAGKSVELLVAADSTIPVSIVAIVTPAASTTYTGSVTGGGTPFSSVVAVPVYN